MADLTRDELVGALKLLHGLLASGEYSDLTITCSGDTYKVHKAVVCSRSGFFKRAERFPAGMEAASGIVDLPEDEPTMAKLLAQYLYEGEYEPTISQIQRGPVVTGPRVEGYRYDFPHTCTPGCPIPYNFVCHHHECTPRTCGESCKNFICDKCCPAYNRLSLVGGPAALLIHAKLYAIGDKYDVKGLQALAREKFLYACAKYWNSEEFVAAARYTCESTPRRDMGLRNTVVETIAEHMELLNKPEVEHLLKEYGELGVGVLKRRAGVLGWIRNEN